MAQGTIGVVEVSHWYGFTPMLSEYAVSWVRCSIPFEHAHLSKVTTRPVGYTVCGVWNRAYFSQCLLVFVNYLGRHQSVLICSTFVAFGNM